MVRLADETTNVQVEAVKGLAVSAPVSTIFGSGAAGPGGSPLAKRQAELLAVHRRVAKENRNARRNSVGGRVVNANAGNSLVQEDTF